jgi:cytochrome b561/polyisoprenoid-binding protein YceI
LQLKNSTLRWGDIAQLFHWVVVALIITQFVLANKAENLPLGMAKLGMLARHKSVGITILGIAVLRLLWRLANRNSPPLPTTLKPYERGLAHLTHYGLYLLLFALPLSGWAMSSAKNYPVSWFGIGGALPNLVAPDEGLFETLKGLHGILASALFFIALLHMAAALWHHFRYKDNVLRRMLPFVGLLLLMLDVPHAVAAKPVATSIATPIAKPVATTTSTPSALWAADPAKSTLEFSFVQAGAKTTGRFARFTASIDFNPVDLAKGKFDVAIDIASLDTRDKDRDSTLRMPDLFDPARFPRATYLATAFAAKGTAFTGTGKLALRGVTRDVPVNFTFTPGLEAGKPIATLKGTAAIKRLLFGIGQGEWKSTEWINDDVQVLFNLLLRPRAGAPAIPTTPTRATSK